MTLQMPFQLQKLPELALIHVLKSMNIEELVWLASLSWKLKRQIARLGIPMPQYRIQRVTNGATQCCFAWSSQDPIVDSAVFDHPGKTTAELKKSCAPVDGYKYSWRYRQNERAMDNLAWLQTVFRGDVVFFIDISLMSVEELAHLKCYESFRNANGIDVVGNTFNASVLTFLLDTVNPELVCRIGSKIPADFRHPTPFRAPTCHYWHGKWLQIEQILELRRPASCVQQIRLIESNFDSRDANAFLHSWVKLGAETIDMLDFMFRDGVIWDTDAIFDGIIALRMQKDSARQFVVITDGLHDEAKPWTQFGVFFCTLLIDDDDNKRYGFAFHVCTEEEYDERWLILDTVRRQQSLRLNLMTIDVQLYENEQKLSRAGWQSGAETMLTMKCDDLRARKVEHRRELSEVDAQLSGRVIFDPSLRVVLTDDIADLV